MIRRGDAGPVEVVLEEDGPDGDEPRGPLADPDDPVARARRRRRGWTAAAVATVVVLVLGAVQAYGDRRERRALEGYADVPGVLRSLAEPVSELWRLPLTETWPVAGTVLTVDADDGVVGRDLDTGEVRWSVALPDGVEGWTIGCARVDARTTVGICAFPRRPGGPGSRQPVDLTLEVMDPATGDTLRTLAVTDSLLAVGIVADHLVLAEREGDGVRVTHEALRTGEQRWQVDLAAYDPASDLRIHGTDDVVVLEAARAVVLDAADGHERGRWTAATDGRERAVVTVVSRPGAGFGVWESRFSGTWYGPGAAAGPRLDGEPVEAPVDDGTRPEVLLLQPSEGDLLTAVDAVTGESLWERPRPDRVLVRLDGRAVLTADGRIESVDLVTGEVAWSTRLDPSHDPALGDPFTDGLRLLLRAEEDDGVRLTAFRLTDGERLWDAPLPDGTDYVEAVGDRLAAVGRLDGSRRQSMAVLG